MGDFTAVDRIATRQHSLVTTAQLQELGWSAGEITTAVALKQLYRDRQGVHRTAGAVRSVEQAWMAAVLAAGPSYVLSHETAALAHCLDPPPEVDAIHVLTSDDRRVRLSGVRSHRTMLLPERDRVEVRSVPLTSVARTIADISRGYSFRRLSLLADNAQRRRILYPRDLWRVAATLPRVGRPVSPTFLALLPQRVPGYQPGDSNPELRVRKLIEDAGLEVPVPLFRVRCAERTYEVDLAWPLAKQGFEWDSFEFHGGGLVVPFHEDRAKLRALRRAGWAIDPITSWTSDEEILEIAALATKASRAARGGAWGGGR